MVTVASILDLTSLGLVAVHLPRPDTAVRWVATSELVDPTPFLEGGEVLLTTGLAAQGWRHREWKAYAGHLAGVGVAALGIGTGLTHRRPPAGLVRACRELSLNLFEVPKEVTFVAISRRTAQLLEEAEEAAARRTLEMQRKLTQAALRMDDAGSLLRRLATVVSGGVCIVSSNGELDAGPFGPAATSLDLAEIATEVLRIRPQGIRAASSLTRPAGVTTIQPLGLRSRPVSYLAAYLPGRPGDGERSAVTTAVALLSLAAESRHDRLQSNRRIRARTLELLMNGEPRTAGIVLGTIHADSVSLPRHVQVLRARGRSDHLDDALAKLEDQKSGLAARTGDELWIVAPADRSSPVVQLLLAAGLRAGVGGAAPLKDAARSLTQAAHALGETTTAAPVIEWDHMVGDGVLALIDRDRAASFSASFLRPLSAVPDREVLLVTLRSFLRHHGSRGGVAHDLGVHRNTVRNRIDQIETLLGRSLDDPQVRVNAWIALHTTATTA